MKFAKLRKFPPIKWLEERASRHKLLAALLLAIIMTFILTGVSLWIYNSGGYYRYDLSRPGYEREREEIIKAEPQRTYDTTSPVTPQAIDEFLVEFDSRIADLKEFGGFSDASLSDKELQIAP